MRGDIIHGDRRSLERHYCQLDLVFRSLDGRIQGHGATLDLSRTNLRFRADDNPPAVGTQIETRIAWPFLLQNVCPLELVLRGPVNKVNERGVILKIASYEFQTCGQRSFTAGDPTPSQSWGFA